MSPALSALITKLVWQRDELQTHLLAVKDESIKVKQQLEEIEQKVSQSSTRYSVEINPEFEMTRLNFITQLHNQKNELAKLLKNQEDLATKLNGKLLRVKTELHMLEKHLEKEQAHQRKQQEKTQEQTLDEWVIQRRNAYENR